MADHKPNNPFQHFQEGTQALLRHATQQLQQGADEIGKAFTHVVHRHARSLQNRQIQPLLPGMAVRLPSELDMACSGLPISPCQGGRSFLRSTWLYTVPCLMRNSQL